MGSGSGLTQEFRAKWGQADFFCATKCPPGRELAGSAPQPDEAFLGNRGDQGAIAREQRPAGEAARALSGGTVLRVENPVVQRMAAMEPHRVVEAGRLDVTVENGAAMGEGRGVEQRH